MVAHASAFAGVEMSFSEGIITCVTLVVGQDDRGTFLISERDTSPRALSP